MLPKFLGELTKCELSGISAIKIMEKEYLCCAAELGGISPMEIMEKEHFDCAAELEDLRRRQSVRNAEMMEANPGDEACFERWQRVYAAQLANLRRMQSARAVTRAAETEASTGQGQDQGRGGASERIPRRPRRPRLCLG